MVLSGLLLSFGCFRWLVEESEVGSWSDSLRPINVLSFLLRHPNFLRGMRMVMLVVIAQFVNMTNCLVDRIRLLIFRHKSDQQVNVLI